MTNSTKQCYLQAHKIGLNYYAARGYRPTFQRLDNEVSNDFCKYLQDNNIQVDLAPPHQHRRNKAERAIRTFKNHFIAMLAGVNPLFPLAAWNELLDHAEITINLLRPSPAHPRQSAWECMNGPYDFDAHPLAPPGTAVTIHEKPAQRATWNKHGVPGFYVGPALSHYRCYRVWTTATSSLRTTDTIAWHPHGYNWEEYSPLELVKETAEALTSALHHLADSDTTMAAHRQPLHSITHELTTQFRALPKVYEMPTSAVDSQSDQRVAIATAGTAVPSVHAVPQAPTTTAPVAPDPHHASGTGDVDTRASQRVCPEQAPTAPTSTKRHQHADAQVPPGFEAPPDTFESRRSARRKHKWLNRANAAAYLDTLNEGQRRAVMLAKRFGSGFHYGDHKHRHRMNQAVRKAHEGITTRFTWSEWAKQPGVELDSNGRPFFMDSHQAPTLFANTAVDLDEEGRKLSMTTALQGDDAHIWLQKHGEEITRLFESGTMRLIHRNMVPPDKKPAYYNPQVRTKIKNGILQHRVRGTIGGNQITYNGDTAAHTASMQLIKLLLNAVISDKSAKFMTADIKDFYLGTPLPVAEYMRINLAHIPDDVIAKHNMLAYSVNGAVIVEINKGIYGLPQAGILAQDRLVKHLAEHGYHQAKHTPCLFKHDTNSVTFTLVVDDFGIKYTNDADADHLMTVLRKLYVMTEDRDTTQKYVGITITHDRKARTITLSMPGYVQKALVRFSKQNITGANSPLIYIPPVIGPGPQMTPEDNPADLEPVDAKTKTYVQEVTGVFLFYSRAVDPTMLTAVNKISMQQSQPTAATLKAIDRLFSYASRHPDAHIVIRPSNMQLQAQSDASYHSETKARSRAGGILYFGLCHDGSINGAVDYISSVIPTVCSSVAEAEYAALFLIGREATNARHILEDLGYPQNPTDIKCDNTCAMGIANGSVKQRRSKAIDMRYHWIRDQVKLGNYSVTWAEGASNLADYFTKAHPVHHYVNMRSTYVHTPAPTTPRDCARSRRINRMNMNQPA